MPGGTAGAVRSEIRTGVLLSNAGHSVKAQEIINGLQRLVNSGTLSLGRHGDCGKLNSGFEGRTFYATLFGR